MSDLDYFRLAIVTWIQSLSAFPTMWANQNYPNLPPNFISLLIISMNNIGLPELGPLDDDGNRLIIFDRKVSLSISVFGQGAFQAASDLLDSLYSRAVIDSFTPQGVTFLDVNALSDTSRLLEKTYQQAAALDLIFYYRPSISENIGKINSIEAAGSYYNGDTLLYTDSINVDSGDTKKCPT